MFGLFKKKKENESVLYPPATQTTSSPLESKEPTPIEEPALPKENIGTPITEAEETHEDIDKTAEEFYFKEPTERELKSLDELLPPLSETIKQEPELSMIPNKNSTLENLCIKIDLEAEDIERKFKEIKSVVSRLNINSPEVFDLLDLYSRAKSKVKSFTEEIDRFDNVGWGIEEETAAFYKFKACKNLSKIRKEMTEIEKLMKESGFTPMKVDEILKTPANKLVDQLARVSVKHKIPHKLEKHKKKRR